MANINFNQIETMGWGFRDVGRWVKKGAKLVALAPAAAVTPTVATGAAAAVITGKDKSFFSRVKRKVAVARMSPEQRRELAAKAARQKATAKRNAAAALANQCVAYAAKITGGAFAAIRQAAFNLDATWMKIHGGPMKNEYPDLYKKAATATSSGALKTIAIWVADVQAHIGTMKNLAKSNDLEKLPTFVNNYTGYIQYMTGPQVFPYVKADPAYKKLAPQLVPLLNGIKQRLAVLQQQAKEAAARIESAWPEFLRLLKLDMKTPPNVATQKFQNEYQTDPKDVEKMREMLDARGISPSAPFDQLIGPMIDFMKAKKKGNFMKIAIPVAVVGAGAAAMALT